MPTSFWTFAGLLTVFLMGFVAGAVTIARWFAHRIQRDPYYLHGFVHGLRQGMTDADEPACIVCGQDLPDAGSPLQRAVHARTELERKITRQRIEHFRLLQEREDLRHELQNKDK